MTMVSVREFRRLLGSSAYGDLKSRLAGESAERLREAWPDFEPLQRLALFKLMDPPRALDFFRGLPYADKYFLFCGFPLDSIAPILEAVGAGERRLFHQMPRDFHERMFSDLLKSKSVSSAAA